MFGFKKPNYISETIGTIVKPSAVEVNNFHLPLAEYEVNGVKYMVRVPYNIAYPMEVKAKEMAGYQNTVADSLRATQDAISNNNSNDAKIVRNNLNFGTSFQGQLMFTIGKKVIVKYDPEKPKKAIVTGEYSE